jgi:Metallo-beta-lactamase superfamily
VADHGIDDLRHIPTMKRKILIALGCIVLVPVLAVAALFAIREPPDGPRVGAVPGVVGVEAGGAYGWIVRTPNGAVLIDAGLDAGGAAILGELKAQGVAPAQVQAVLLTHGQTGAQQRSSA